MAKLIKVWHVLQRNKNHGFTTVAVKTTRTEAAKVKRDIELAGGEAYVVRTSEQRPTVEAQR